MPAGSTVTVSADLWYDIEANYDYLYAEYSTDGGATWTQIGQPVTGSGTKWATKRWSYKPADATAPTLFQVRYATDGGVNEAGAFLDNISVKIGQTVVATDGAEQGDNGWTVKGWKASTGTEVTNAERYYLLENRQYVGYDTTLAEGPYQFSEAYTRPDWVEHFPFQNGMLVWMVDQGYADNNVSTHPVPDTPCRSTCAPTRSRTRTAPARATDVSRSTRRSGSRRRRDLPPQGGRTQGRHVCRHPAPARRRSRACRPSTTPTHWPTTRRCAAELGEGGRGGRQGDGRQGQGGVLTVSRSPTPPVATPERLTHTGRGPGNIAGAPSARSRTGTASGRDQGASG